MLPLVESASWVSLIPAVSVLVIALMTQRTFEALLGGTLVGWMLISGTDFFNAFADSMLKVMQNETVGWIILVVGLFGSFIGLLVRSGGTKAFGEAVSSRVRSSSGALLATWFMGLVIFLDDYLNALAVGGAMQRVRPARLGSPQRTCSARQCLLKTLRRASKRRRPARGTS